MATTGKADGLAQRVRADAAVVTGCVLVDDRVAKYEIMTPVYRALLMPFNPASVGDLAAAGGDYGPADVERAPRATFASQA